MSYKGNKILAVVPSRGGSKGVIRKNLEKINNVSLIGRTAIICSKLGYLDGSIISTDDLEMQAEGIKYGLDAPFIRPSELSSDESNVFDMWKHAIIEAQKFYDDKFDLSILLEPTSPMRNTEHINSSIEKYLNGNYDFLMTLSETDSKHHPYKQLVIDNDEINFFAEKGKSVINRQELNRVYHRNGVAYIINCKYLLNSDSVSKSHWGGHVIKDIIINIDTYHDLELARYFMTINK